MIWPWAFVVIPFTYVPSSVAFVFDLEIVSWLIVILSAELAVDIKVPPSISIVSSFALATAFEPLSAVNVL